MGSKPVAPIEKHPFVGAIRMPWAYTIDVEQKTVFTRLFGSIVPPEIKAHTAALKADPLFDPQFNNLIDASEAMWTEIPTEKIREFASESNFDKNARRAIVVRGDLAFGLARMFATYRELHGETHLNIFRSRNDALDWLGAKESTAVEHHSSEV